MKFGLHNIRALLRAVGNPQRSLKTVHFAGTNGKGSTSSMIAAVLTAAGYKVGLYTSPHLVKFNERIRINGKMISIKEVEQYTDLFRPHIIRCKATFFEATTAIAFKFFADQKVDIAVIETGLGGRLDSTNVISPLVSVITSIGKDHTELLGTTISSIAREKGGIIKRNIPVVLGKLPVNAEKVITSIAKLKRSPILPSSKLSIPDDIEIELKGKHQTANAKAALGAINVISRRMLIGNNAVREGLEHTSKLTGLRARFELRRGTPDMLFDVAHNSDGMKVLVNELKGLPYHGFVIIFSVMKDKNYRSILQQLRSLKPTIIATQPDLERALPYKELYLLCKKMNFQCFPAPSVREAVSIGIKKTKGKSLLVVTGSHYLLGEAIPFLEKNS